MWKSNAWYSWASQSGRDTKVGYIGYQIDPKLIWWHGCCPIALLSPKQTAPSSIIHLPYPMQTLSMSRGGWCVMDSSTCSTWAAIICHSSLNFAESTSAKLIPIQQSVKRRKCIPTVPFRKILFLLGMQIENIKRWKCQHGVIWYIETFVCL